MALYSPYVLAVTPIDPEPIRAPNYMRGTFPPSWGPPPTGGSENRAAWVRRQVDEYRSAGAAYVRRMRHLHMLRAAPPA